MRYPGGSQRFVFLGVAAAILLAIQALAGDVRSANPQTGGKPVEKIKPVSFHSAVLPLLQANCQGCHQPAKASGKLDLTSFKDLLTAGESGSKAIVPGKPDESYLLEQITPTKGEAA